MSRNTEAERVCPICDKVFKVKRKEAREVNCCCVDHANVWKNKKRQIEVSAPFGMPIRELLIDLYHNQQLGIKKIAKVLDISDRTAWSWLDELGIERRDLSAAVSLQWVDNTERRLQSAEVMRVLIADGIINNHGENNPAKRPESRRKNSESKRGANNPMHGVMGERNPHWRGGKIPVTEYGRDWLVIRKLVNERDGFRCQHCGTADNLGTHHIVPFRECRTHEMHNLITLCATCHNMVHSGKIECPRLASEKGNTL